MAWFKKDKAAEKEVRPRAKTVEGMWLKCNHCREIVYRKEVDRNNKVCPKCDYHFPISVMERIALLTDLGTFKEWDSDLEPQDPLHFTAAAWGRWSARSSAAPRTARTSTGCRCC